MRRKPAWIKKYFAEAKDKQLVYRDCNLTKTFHSVRSVEKVEKLVPHGRNINLAAHIYLKCSIKGIFFHN